MVCFFRRSHAWAGFSRHHFFLLGAVAAFLLAAPVEAADETPGAPTTFFSTSDRSDRLELIREWLKSIQAEIQNKHQTTDLDRVFVDTLYLASFRDFKKIFGKVPSEVSAAEWLEVGDSVRKATSFSWAKVYFGDAFDPGVMGHSQVEAYVLLYKQSIAGAKAKPNTPESMKWQSQQQSAASITASRAAPKTFQNPYGRPQERETDTRPRATIAKEFENSVDTLVATNSVATLLADFELSRTFADYVRIVATGRDVAAGSEIESYQETRGKIFVPAYRSLAQRRQLSPKSSFVWATCEKPAMPTVRPIPASGSVADLLVQGDFEQLRSTSQSYPLVFASYIKHADQQCGADQPGGAVGWTLTKTTTRSAGWSRYSNSDSATFQVSQRLLPYCLSTFESADYTANSGSIAKQFNIGRYMGATDAGWQKIFSGIGCGTPEAAYLVEMWVDFMSGRQSPQELLADWNGLNYSDRLFPPAYYHAVRNRNGNEVDSAIAGEIGVQPTSLSLSQQAALATQRLVKLAAALEIPENEVTRAILDGRLSLDVLDLRLAWEGLRQQGESMAEVNRRWNQRFGSLDFDGTIRVWAGGAYRQCTARDIAFICRRKANGLDEKYRFPRFNFYLFDEARRFIDASGG